MSKSIILYCLCLIAFCAAQAQSPIHLDASFTQKDITTYGTVFEDTTRALDIQQVRELYAESFIEMNKTPYFFPYESGVFWCKFTLHNATDEYRKYDIQFKHPPVHSVEMYLDSSNTVEAVGGYAYAQEEKKLRVPGFAASFLIAPQQTRDVYLKVFNYERAIVYSVCLYNDNEFTNYLQEGNLYLNLYYGLMITLSLVSLLMAMAFGNAIIWFYALNMVGRTLWSLALDGYMHTFLPVEYNNDFRLITVLLYFSTIVYALFVRSFLELKKYQSTLDKVLVVSVIVATFINIPLFFGNQLWVLWVAKIDESAFPLLGIVMLIAIIRSLKYDKRKASFYLVGYFIFAISGTIKVYSNQDINLMPEDYAEFTFKTMSAVEAMIIAFIVIEDFLKKRKAKDELVVQLHIQNNKNLETKNLEILNVNKSLDKLNSRLLSSINYAQRIQNVILPREQELKNAFQDIFVLLLPKDIVSGDFYFFRQKDNYKLLACVDCTGHGVPGAFMSVMSFNLLYYASEYHSAPGPILNMVKEEISRIFRADKTYRNDGMDIAMCGIDDYAELIHYAGVRIPVLYVDNGEVLEIRPKRNQIGGRIYQDDVIEADIIPNKKGMPFYMFSDGYPDLFSDDTKAIKMGRKRIKKLLSSFKDMPMEEQKEAVHSAIKEWKGNQAQVDDILVIGFTLKH